MTLLLSNEEIETILNMEGCLAALQEAYQDLAAEVTTEGLRSDVVSPSSHPDAVHSLKVYSTAFPRREVAAIRLNSDLLTFRRGAVGKQRSKIPAAPGERWVGLVLLFSTSTGEPLAIFPDGVAQRARVGAASGLALKILGRPDVAELAIIGSGWQAGAQAMAACAVRKIRRIRIFSPNALNRERFCAAWEGTLGVSFLPVESVAEAARGADAILCATNSMRPVLAAEVVEPGMHVGFIRIPEAGADVLARADVVVRHTPPELSTVQLLKGADSPDVRGDRGWDSSGADKLGGLPDLKDLVGGRVAGRSNPDQVTCFLNNTGMGLQFAAVGHAIWESARLRGVGRELPTEWFTESVHP